MESRLYNYKRPLGTVRRPAGFTVVEPAPVAGRRRTDTATYLVYRVGVDTRIVAGMLAGILEARGYVVSGLKDACARVYQYVSLISPSRVEDMVSTSMFKAWLAGRGFSIWPGSHVYNMFRLIVETPDPRSVCSNAIGITRIPGFFGPQRFGVERPNTHYIGLLYSMNMKGSIIKEYMYRYPLEERRKPGRYEARELTRSREKIDPWAIKTPRMALEALQAYIYNRALSKALPKVDELAEHYVTVSCGLGQVKMPAARLPAPRLAKGKSRWAKLIAGILEEEGLTLENLRGLKPSFRPLLYPVCNLKCRAGSGKAKLTFNLPKGAYATTLLSEVVELDWLEYSTCKAR